MNVELEERVSVIEEKLEQLLEERRRLPKQAWRKTAGDFADDPGFDEMMRLGKEYRESQKPGDGDADS